MPSSLATLQAKGEPRVKKLRRPRGAMYVIVRFEDVHLGDYVVAFEPLSSK